MIEAIDLTSARRARTAVDGVSFDVYPGQVTALLGPPGSGKSTVLRMMAELEPGTGRTLFSGHPYHALRPAIREAGFALDPDALHPGRTLHAHLRLFAAGGGVPKARFVEVLEIAGLTVEAGIRCGRLDPGQRQRLAIAAALLGDPAALIVDEPRGLDAHGTAWFHSLLRAYAAQGRTVLVAASRLEDLAGTADHLIVMRRDEEDGKCRLIASRAAAEVFAARRASVVVVRSPQAARLSAALESQGAKLAPAGPGALEVRGLDRARIGEIAHAAGICLHELADIDSPEDDLFPMSAPYGVVAAVPAQADNATPQTAAGAVLIAGWNAGVRLVPADGGHDGEADSDRNETARAKSEPTPAVPDAAAEDTADVPVAEAAATESAPASPASEPTEAEQVTA